MATNETPDQFRERIGRIVSDAEDDRWNEVYRSSGRAWDRLDTEERSICIAGALAVYTQAVEDVLSFVDAATEVSDYLFITDGKSLYEAIAAELDKRGITLTESEAQ